MHLLEVTGPEGMTATEVMQMILNAAHCQIVSSAEGKAILEAGLGAQLHELLHSIAANAAQPIAWSAEDPDDERR